MKHIILVDDNAEDRKHYASLLNKNRHVPCLVHSCSTVEEVISLVGEFPDAIILTDHLLGHEITSVTLIEQVLEVGFEGLILVITGADDPSTKHLITEAGAFTLLPKHNMNAGFLGFALEMAVRIQAEPDPLMMIQDIKRHTINVRHIHGISINIHEIMGMVKTIYENQDSPGKVAQGFHWLSEITKRPAMVLAVMVVILLFVLVMIMMAYNPEWIKTLAQ